MDMQNPKVLYIDDEEMNLMLFSRIFKKKLDVVTALSGEEGLELLGSLEGIDAVITDLSMPGMDGIEFIKRAYEKFPTKRYYILSGHEHHPEMEEFSEKGILSAQLNKPFQSDQILRELAGK